MSMKGLFGQDAYLSARASDSFRAMEKAMPTADRLYLISDFDHTLTDFSSRQCHDIVGLHSEYPKEFHDEFHRLCSMPYDPTNFEQWWRMSHDLIVERSGLTEDMFMEEMHRSNIALRSGTKELLTFCRQSKVTTIVASAGIMNVIEATLKAHGISPDSDEHFHVDANYIVFRDDGNILSILPERPVHSNAKKYMHIRAPHLFDSSDYGYQEAAGDDQNDGKPSTLNFAAVVLGDREGDFEIFSEHEGVILFKVGFAVTQERAEELVAKKCCDVVLIGKNHGVEPVLELMRQLVALRGLDSSDCDRDEELLGPERLDATTQLRVSSTKWDDYYIKAKAEGLSPPWESTVPFAELKEWIDWSLLSNTQKISAIPAAPLTLASADGADAGISAAFALDTSATVTVPAVLKAGGDIGETAKFGSVAAPLPPSKFIELGCGSSASACWLVALGYDVTAVDISLPGLIRAQSQRNEGADRVSWLLADLLSPRLFQEAHPVIGEEGKAQFESKQVEVTVGSIPSVEDSRASGSIHTFGVQAETVALKNCHRAPLIEASYDALFDLQCFHALRDVDEKRICSVISKLVKPGGVAMIVTGAPEGKSEGSVEVEVEATQPGPPRLSAEEVVDPFKAEGLELVNIWKSRFNPTAAYSAAGKLPPACWVAVFRKPSIAV